MSDSRATDPALPECEECIDPAEAFALVGSETRLDILEALWKAPERPVSFSDLRDRVGMRDSARFNYHLGKLTGQFVRKTDDGYEFRYAGEKVVRAVVAGTFNEDPRIDPFELEGSCAVCGDRLSARYDDERLTVACRGCGRVHASYSFPPGGLRGRTRDEILRAFDQRVRHLHCLAADGVCPECGGRMETTVRRDRSEETSFAVRVDHRCEQCAHRVSSPVGLTLLDQSDVVAFHRDHGIDLHATPHWRLTWCVGDRHADVVSEDPVRVRVRIPLDDEELRLTLDAALAVVGVERRSRSPDTDAREAV